MTNEELIKALRNCSSPRVDSCIDCPYYKDVSCKWQMMEDAADALEGAYEMIDDCVAAIDALNDSNDAYIKENERLKNRIAELEEQDSVEMHSKQVARMDEVDRLLKSDILSAPSAYEGDLLYCEIHNGKGARLNKQLRRAAIKEGVKAEYEELVEERQKVLKELHEFGVTEAEE